MPFIIYALLSLYFMNASHLLYRKNDWSIVTINYIHCLECVLWAERKVFNPLLPLFYNFIFLQHYYWERRKWIFKSLGNHSGKNVNSSIIDYLFSSKLWTRFWMHYLCVCFSHPHALELSGLHELFVIVDMINLFDICKLSADIYHTTPQYCFGQQSM